MGPKPWASALVSGHWFAGLWLLMVTISLYESCLQMILSTPETTDEQCFLKSQSRLCALIVGESVSS